MSGQGLIGREPELSYLEGLWQQKGLVTCCLWGRRRVGKTSILREFAKGKRALFLQGIRGSYYENLSSLSLDVSEFLGVEVPQASDLSHFMKLVESICKEEHTLVIFDEIPYLLESAAQASSVIQKSLDRGLKDLDCMFVICGSSISVMRRETEDARKPLYGRFDHRKQILPLPIDRCREFHPNMDPETSLKWYCTVGGIPYYHLGTDGKDYQKLMTEKFLDADSSWRGDAASTILQEFNGNSQYTGVVRCIADGSVKQSEIADKMKIDRAACKRILDDLEFVGIVERRIPMGGSPKKPVYSIRDPFISFSYSILSSNERLIENSPSKNAVYEVLKQPIDSHLGSVFEKVCGDWLDSNYEVIERGQWWGRIDDTDSDIDIVAKVSDGNRSVRTVLAECKFRRKPTGFQAYNALVSKAGYANFTDNLIFMMFSASGFEEEFAEYAEENGIILVDGDMLLRRKDPPKLFRCVLDIDDRYRLWLSGRCIQPAPDRNVNYLWVFALLINFIN